ncbi:hypothetical protein B0H11DRAFT_1963535 [Mycena galericulata]|nr:hypothetical protein B0H11DRAFT_1963535 [Mycena galericulata]
MAQAQPDEILLKILAPLLTVPDDKFADTSATSPFALPQTASSSIILLVCKTWLRICTPLLYNVVIIRSRAQAGALSATLNANRKLGPFVKKLRIEGGFGRPMRNILKNTPNVSDLFISADIHPPDTISGLLLGLPLLNPARLIIFEPPLTRDRTGHDNLPKNQWTTKLFETLAAQCTHNIWTNLTTFQISLHRHWDEYPRYTFLNAIFFSKTLKIVSVFLDLEFRFPYMLLLNTISEIPSLQALEIRSPSKSFPFDFFSDPQTLPRLKSIVKFSVAERQEQGPEVHIEVLPPTDPAFRPMAFVPQPVVDKIWSRILFFATHKFSVPPSHRDTNPNALNFILVSKSFCQLALPYLYAAPFIHDYRALGEFADRLAADPSLGRYVREMHIPLMYPDPAPSCYVDIFACTSRLIRLTTKHNVLPRSAFEVLARTAGDTLTEFNVHHVASSTHFDPTIFLSFKALRVLEWESPAVFSRRPAGALVDEGSDSLSAALPALEILEVRSPGIFPALEQIALPNLRRLVLGGYVDDGVQFLCIHGSKFREIKLWDWETHGPDVLAHCPAVSHLNFKLAMPSSTRNPLKPRRFIELQEPWFPPLTSHSPHQSLAKLIVRKDRHPSEERKEWAAFFNVAEWSDFPALCEVQIIGLKWPTRERNVVDNQWVKWAEELLEYNIRLTDELGRHWRPRLKVGSR